MIWWEKTVEYKFIENLFKEKYITEIAPLDGEQEQIVGDAVATFSNKWIVIEFKRDYSSLTSERAKFNNYEEARQALSEDGKYHYFIYGNCNEEQGFHLQYKNYWNNDSLTLKLNDLWDGGFSLDNFKTYLENLKKAKNVKEKNGGDSMVAMGIQDKMVVFLAINDFTFSLDNKLSIDNFFSDSDSTNIEEKKSNRKLKL